ncbi:MAG: hypothetical protein EOM37_03415 [Proteobacteria bacterium]|jgi:hypothetical protein|nr:hypothetical protein [Alphaproteobacteria bacterium]NCC03086.1 hypothetical protein [Pseudomonadota bacterium]
MSKAAIETLITDLKSQFIRMDAGEEGRCGSRCWMTYTQPANSPTIESDQFVSISALISYLAFSTGKHPVTIERDISNHYCIPNLKCLPADLYDQVVRYVCDQMPAAAHS